MCSLIVTAKHVTNGTRHKWLTEISQSLQSVQQLNRSYNTLTVESHDAVTKMPSFQDKHETKIQLQNTNNWIFFYHFQTQSGLKTLKKKFPYSFNHNVLEYRLVLK